MSGHEPDYEPPFGGRPQAKEEMERIHARWLEKNCQPYGPPKRDGEIGRLWDGGALLQCGGCAYYIPLEGSIGMDWGACSNPRSPLDGKVTMEHHGCMAYNNWDLDASSTGGDALDRGSREVSIEGTRGED